MNCRYESLDDHLNERSSSWSHWLEAQIPSIQGFGASNLHIWHMRYGEVTWKTHIGSFLRRAWRTLYMWCPTSKCILRQANIFCWLNLVNSHAIICPLANYMFSTMARPPIFRLVSQPSNPTFPVQLAKQGFDTWHKSTTMWKASWFPIEKS